MSKECTGQVKIFGHDFWQINAPFTLEKKKKFSVSIHYGCTHLSQIYDMDMP
jgi:hypothetical protein